MPLDPVKIRSLMKDRTLAGVAAAAGMMQPSLSRILSGKFDPKLSTVEKLAKALKVPVSRILRAE